jgi:hypothetical protein
VTERLAPALGEVLEPLDEDEVREAARFLAGNGIEAVAVCFLFSYRDDAVDGRRKAGQTEVRRWWDHHFHGDAMNGDGNVLVEERTSLAIGEHATGA